MTFGETVVHFKNLHQKQSWPFSRIAREYGISKGVAARICEGVKPKDPSILAKLHLTKPWRHLDDLTPAQVKYIFDNRETMP